MFLPFYLTFLLEVTQDRIGKCKPRMSCHLFVHSLNTYYIDVVYYEQIIYKQIRIYWAVYMVIFLAELLVYYGIIKIIIMANSYLTFVVCSWCSKSFTTAL